LGKWFMVEKNAQQKTARGREVLQESDCHHAKMACCVTKPDQRQTGYNAGADQDQRKRPVDLAEDQPASSLETEQVEKSNRSQQGCLEKKAGDRRGPRLFA